MFDAQKMVQDFHLKYGAVCNSRPTMLSADDAVRRISLIFEEGSEFAGFTRKKDMVGMIDSLCDLLYVTYGTAVEMGIDLQPFFEEVHKSNMTKTSDKDSGGKIMKGPNFVAPDIKKYLDAQEWYDFDAK